MTQCESHMWLGKEWQKRTCIKDPKLREDTQKSVFQSLCIYLFFFSQLFPWITLEFNRQRGGKRDWFNLTHLCSHLSRHCKWVRDCLGRSIKGRKESMLGCGNMFLKDFFRGAVAVIMKVWSDSARAISISEKGPGERSCMFHSTSWFCMIWMLHWTFSEEVCTHRCTQNVQPQK